MARRQEHDIKVSVEERVSSASRCSCHKAKERIIASLEQACGHDLPATLPDDLRDVDEDDLEPLPPSCCCEGFNAPDLHEVVEAVKRMKTKDVSTMLDHLLCLKCEHELKFHRPLLEVERSLWDTVRRGRSQWACDVSRRLWVPVPSLFSVKDEEGGMLSRPARILKDHKATEALELLYWRRFDLPSPRGLNVPGEGAADADFFLMVMSEELTSDCVACLLLLTGLDAVLVIDGQGTLKLFSPLAQDDPSSCARWLEWSPAVTWHPPAGRLLCADWDEDRLLTAAGEDGMVYVARLPQLSPNSCPSPPLLLLPDAAGEEHRNFVMDVRFIQQEAARQAGEQLICSCSLDRRIVVWRFNAVNSDLTTMFSINVGQQILSIHCSPPSSSSSSSPSCLPSYPFSSPSSPSSSTTSKDRYAGSSVFMLNRAGQLGRILLPQFAHNVSVVPLMCNP